MAMGKNMRNTIADIVEASIALKKRFFDKNVDVIIQTADVMAKALAGGNKLLLFGNGGSAADAQHIAAELVNRFVIDRPGLPAIALTTDSSALTSIGNDLGFEFLFSRQVEALGKRGDVAVGISTSGNSPNVIRGLERARAMGIITVAQEVHIMIGHILCELVENQIVKRET
jgi:D-sedoheptulose 7-phosphate isomerase